MKIYGKILNAATNQALAGARMLVRIGGREVSTSSGPTGEFEWRDDRSHVGEIVELTVEEERFEAWRTSHEIATTEIEVEIRLQPIESKAVIRQPDAPVVTRNAAEKRSIPVSWLVIGGLIVLLVVLGLYVYLDRQAAKEPEPEWSAPHEGEYQ